jgi:hypothetical protein
MYCFHQVFGHYKYLALDYYDVDNVNINTAYSHPAYAYLRSFLSLVEGVL